MGNLPNITHAEVAVFSTAIVLLFVAPAVLSWGDARRRRRAQRAALAAESLRLASTVEPLVSTVEPFAFVAEPTLPIPDAAAVEFTSTAEQPPAVPVAQPSEPVAGFGVAATAVEEPSGAPAPWAASQSVPMDPPALQPLSGEVRHRFRLDELHEAQLSDWPPAAIRDDPERRRARSEAEQAAKPYQAQIRGLIIGSPYPARAQCLGAADVDASELRLSFLLFPVVWPVSQNQAVAQAVLRVDRTTGEVRGWVDALRPQELSEENRREVREAGGAA